MSLRQLTAFDQVTNIYVFKGDEIKLTLFLYYYSIFPIPQNL